MILFELAYRVHWPDAHLNFENALKGVVKIAKLTITAYGDIWIVEVGQSDFAEIEELQHTSDWDELNTIMAESAQHLYKGGADLIVLCTNTMHLCSHAIVDATPLPFIHITDATGKAIQGKYLTKVGLLGTKFTTQKDFYKKRLQEEYDIYTVIPDEDDQDVVNSIIYNELVKGEFKEDSKNQMIQIMEKLRHKGAEGIILRCTEIPLLVSQSDIDMLLFNTTEIYATEAVSQAPKI